MMSSAKDEHCRFERPIEIYENERMWIGRGFSKMGLLPAGRGPYSTKDGSLSWKTMHAASIALLRGNVMGYSKNGEGVADTKNDNCNGKSVLKRVRRGWSFHEEDDNNENNDDSDLRKEDEYECTESGFNTEGDYCGFVPTSESDEDGWQYFPDFSPQSMSKSPNGKRGMLDFVRRRNLRRRALFRPDHFLPREVYTKCDYCDSSVVNMLSSAMLDALSLATLVAYGLEDNDVTDAQALPLKSKLIDTLSIGENCDNDTQSEEYDPWAGIHNVKDRLCTFAEKCAGEPLPNPNVDQNLVAAMPDRRKVMGSGRLTNASMRMVDAAACAVPDRRKVMESYLNEQERLNLARLLIKDVDRYSYKMHCRRDSCACVTNAANGNSDHDDDEEDACEFRLISCPNEHCNAIFSFKHRSQHDDECEYKHIPCPSGCETEVPRKEVHVHVVAEDEEEKLKSKQEDVEDVKGTKQYAITSDAGDHDTVGTVTVEFPSDRTSFLRTPFLRRTSMDLYQSSVGSLSGNNDGGSLGSKDQRRGTRGGVGDSSDNDSSTANSGSEENIMVQQSLAASRKSKEGLVRLTQLHDENVMAVPLLVCDKDIDDSNSYSRSSFGPASIQPMPPGMKSSASNTGFISSSLKASQYDSYEAVNALCEDFVPRGSFRKNDQGMPGCSSLGPLNESNNDQNISNSCEEYDPRKPWRKAPAGAVEIQDQKKRSSSGNMNGITMLSSFSDTSFDDLEALHAAIGNGDVDRQDKDTMPTETVTAKPPTPTEEDMVTSAANRSPHSDGDTLRENIFRASMCSKATSALSDNDDSSELTELRLAQEALFSVLDSDTESVTSSEIKEIRVDNTAPTALSSSIRSGGSASRSKDLSSLDIVQEEHQYHQDHQLSRSQLSQQQLDLLEERDGSDGENVINPLPRPTMVRMSSMDDDQRMLNWMICELDDLPSCKHFKHLSHRGFGSKDDDSISYSDIDMEPGPPHPSIKMCMTVRDSAIEREFATEQLADVEFGETKEPHEGETTLQDLLESRNHMDDSYHPLPFNLDDSLRSGGDTTSSKKSSSKRTISTISDKKHFITKSVRKQTNKLDTKATKNLRRKNKRLWKFCVWNCRKITVCLMLGLCLLVGIALLTWWGVAKVTGKDNDNDDVDIGAVNDEGRSAAPTGPEGKQWPPTKDSGRIPPPLDGQMPSLSPSSLTSTDNLVAPIPVIELPPELPSFSSEVPVSVLDPEEQILSMAPSPANILDVPSFSLSSRPLTSIEPTNDALQSQSSSPNSTTIANINNDANTQLFPTSSPSPSTNSSFIQSPTVNTSDAQPYPSSSPSTSNPPSTTNSSYVSSFIIQTPTVNSVNVSSYPSLSPSISNNTAGISLPPVANSSITAVPPTVSTSNNASYTPGNASYVEPLSGNSSVVSSIRKRWRKHNGG